MGALEKSLNQHQQNDCKDLDCLILKSPQSVVISLSVLRYFSPTTLLKVHRNKMKHYKFNVVFEQQQVPVGCEEINWTKNWLAQHIKNTDHQYKGRFLTSE